ncbi:hypothetical protein EF906_11745 [Streptomyces sp. WAC08241]|nr:hypothetical protein EF906_11745 [Streptomyces sp. WAC08241]
MACRRARPPLLRQSRPEYCPRWKSGPLHAQEEEGWDTAHGSALITELGRWPGGRALYDPRPGELGKPGPGVACRFHHTGDTP